MAGTRRGAGGSGRVTRADARPVERRARLQERLDNAKTAREKVSWVSAHLRSIMADPDVDDANSNRAAEQAVIYLLRLSDDLEATITRKEKK
jgi:hypothetical protein